jgi:hypothetical protein
MNKFILAIAMMVIASTTVNSVMAGDKPCSKSRLMQKAQNNQRQAQQEQMWCHQGNRYMCKKAQDDFQDAQKYQMKAMRCPFP